MESPFNSSSQGLDGLAPRIRRPGRLKLKEQLRFNDGDRQRAKDMRRLADKGYTWKAISARFDDMPETTCREWVEAIRELWEDAGLS